MLLLIPRHLWSLLVLLQERLEEVVLAHSCVVVSEGHLLRAVVRIERHVAARGVQCVVRTRHRVRRGVGRRRR